MEIKQDIDSMSRIEFLYFINSLICYYNTLYSDRLELFEIDFEKLKDSF